MIAIGLSAMPIFARLTRGQVIAIPQRRVYRRRAGDWSAGSLDYHQIRLPERGVADPSTGHAGDCLGDYRQKASLSFLGLGQQPQSVMGLNAQHPAKRFLSRRRGCPVFPGVAIFPPCRA